MVMYHVSIIGEIHPGFIPDLEQNIVMVPLIMDKFLIEFTIGYLKNRNPLNAKSAIPGTRD